MIRINKTELWEIPTSCNVCPFFSSGNSAMSYSERGHCRLFDEMHKGIINPPRRCLKIFKKAFTYPEGATLVIIRETDM